LDILYNPKYKVDITIFCYVIEKLKNKLVSKVSDVEREETYYRVKNADYGDDWIEFDDLVDQIIRGMISETIIDEDNVIIKEIKALCYQLLYFCEFDAQTKEKSKNSVAERDGDAYTRFYTHFPLNLVTIRKEYLEQYSQGKKDFFDFLILKFDNNVDNFDNMGNNIIINDGNNNIINDNFLNGDNDNDNKEEFSDNSEELDKYLSYL
jgi:hypothetical protein